MGDIEQEKKAERKVSTLLLSAIMMKLLIYKRTNVSYDHKNKKVSLEKSCGNQ